MSAQIFQITTHKNIVQQLVNAIAVPISGLTTQSQNERLHQLHMADPATRMVASPRCPCGCWDSLMQNGGMV